jgi:hypothetical protein
MTQNLVGRSARGWHWTANLKNTAKSLERAAMLNEGPSRNTERYLAPLVHPRPYHRIPRFNSQSLPELVRKLKRPSFLTSKESDGALCVLWFQNFGGGSGRAVGR